MQYLKFMFVSIFITQMLSSCTEVIDLDLNELDPQMVVEGYINDQPGPYYVKVTTTVNFDDSNNYPPVSDAQVFISDSEGVTDTLAEVEPGLYATTFIQGKPGNTYILKVKTADKAFTSTSKMPAPVALDTAYTDQLPGQSGGENKVPVVEFRDPVGMGNHYNITAKRDGWYLPGFYTVTDDVRDGQVISRPMRANNLDIQAGDVLLVELQCVEPAVYDYFYVLGQAAGTGMGPSPTPSNPTGNISGGALGYFSAYTSSVKTIIAK
jgi:Domain of unknown function (DUF4249)